MSKDKVRLDICCRLALIADDDGIDDLYDNNDAAFAGGANNGITPYNHDGADTPDYIDINSDNDSVNDLREAFR